MGNLSMSFLATVAIGILISVFLYYILPVRFRRAVLLVISLVFYLCFDWRYLPFLLFTALSTFLVARRVKTAKHRKLWIGTVIALNAGIWFAVKVLPWGLDITFRALETFGANVQRITPGFIVPLGISYFTLQAIAYMVDVSKGKSEAETNFFRYLLFLAWFPAITQGPISRYDQLMPQLCNERPFSVERVRRAAFLVLVGVVKKMVIADRLGIMADYCFEYYETLYGFELYIGAIAYSIQLYIDFSACVDIFRGVSALFGVDMIHNFDRPYLATSIKDFWSRWHISLSSWLKDYIYVPLGGSRRGKGRKYINLIITFLVSGLWHGAGFSFFLWGMLHAVYQIVDDATTELRRKIKRWIGVVEGSRSERIYQTLITFHLVAFAWIFFRADSLTGAFGYIHNLFSQFNLWVLLDGSVGELGLSMRHIVFLAVHLCLLFSAERHYSRQEDAIETVMDMHLFLRWFVYLILIYDVILFGAYGAGYNLSSFMYGGF